MSGDSQDALVTFIAFALYTAIGSTVALGLACWFYIAWRLLHG